MNKFCRIRREKIPTFMQLLFWGKLHWLIKIRFPDIKMIFYKHRNSRSKLLCKNDVFKLVKMFLKVSQNSRESICVWVLFWKNRLIKKPPTQVFSCKFCKIFKNTYFEERLTANGCLLICFMKINPLPQRDQKISALVFFYTSEYLCFPAFSRLHVICVDQSNFKSCSIEQ